MTGIRELLSQPMDRREAAKRIGAAGIAIGMVWLDYRSWQSVFAVDAQEKRGLEALASQFPNPSDQEVADAQAIVAQHHEVETAWITVREEEIFNSKTQEINRHVDDKRMEGFVGGILTTMGATISGIRTFVKLDWKNLDIFS